MRFTVIDFETANAKRTSACSLGITVVDDNKIVSSKEYLIKPYPCAFDPMNVMIHGITEEMVQDAPTFDKLWYSISEFFEGQVVVAHNTSFDISVLMRTLEHYNIPLPSFEFLCTYRISQQLHRELPCYRLDFLSKIFDIPLCHHNSCSDSIACANLLIRYMEKNNVCAISDVQEKLGTDFGVCSSERYIPCRHHSEVPYKKHKTSAKEFKDAAVIHLDDDFEGKYFVFTGTLSSMTRARAMEIVASGGGYPQDAVTKKTNYLVVGVQNLDVVKDGNSSKMKKAASYKLAGCDIEVIGEEDFVNMIDEELLNI